MQLSLFEKNEEKKPNNNDRDLEIRTAGASRPRRSRRELFCLSLLGHYIDEAQEKFGENASLDLVSEYTSAKCQAVYAGDVRCPLADECRIYQKAKRAGKITVYDLKHPEMKQT